MADFMIGVLGDVWTRRLVRFLAPGSPGDLLQGLVLGKGKLGQPLVRHFWAAVTPAPAGAS